MLSRVRGETYTLAPADTPVERLYEFKAGGLLPENVERLRQEYLQAHGNLVAVESLVEVEAEIIRTALLAVPLGICVFDDVTPRWSELLPNPGPAAFNIDEEVYHSLPSGAGVDEIVDLLCLTNAIWHGLVTVCTEDLALPAASATLTRCAETATLVGCTAYDREGFLIWRRKA